MVFRKRIKELAYIVQITRFHGIIEFGFHWISSWLRGCRIKGVWIDWTRSWCSSALILFFEAFWFDNFGPKNNQYLLLCINHYFELLAYIICSLQIEILVFGCILATVWYMIAHFSDVLALEVSNHLWCLICKRVWAQIRWWRIWALVDQILKTLDHHCIILLMYN